MSFFPQHPKLAGTFDAGSQVVALGLGGKKKTSQTKNLKFGMTDLWID